MKSLIQILKKCEWCGKEFAAYKCSTRYCSKQCNGYAYKDNLRKKRIEACHNEMEMQEAEKNLDGATSRNYLTPTQAAKLLGIGRATLYRYLSDNRITAIQFKGKTLIRRKDIDKLFDAPKPYQKRPKKDRAPITEFYTNDELREKFDVSLSWIFKVGKEENVPKIMRRGKTLWSKKHFDAILARRTHDESITEWYSVEDMRQKFEMTLSAVYSFVYTYGIPKKKVKREVFYSKRHVDTAKGVAVPAQPEYYTIPEAMEKYGLTRDQLYHYVKWHKVPKIQQGRYVKISKKELDDLLAPPVL